MAPKRAVLSVSDKTGLIEFASGLLKYGYELISTGGTYKVLQEAGLAVTYVSEITGFPEILDGRVKTLHPKIHGGILAMDTPEHRAQCEQAGIEFIDLVCVNLYPFRETIAKDNVTFEEAIENIDIGGPTMVRAAAKNHSRVTIVVNPANYEQVLASIAENGTVSPALRQKLAAEAFAHTADYDRLIADYLEKQQATEVFFPQNLRITATKLQDLRYGENPAQKGAFYLDLEAGRGTLGYARQLQGKELSYNNWMDMDAAWGAVQEFSAPACVIVKHTNPCGAAVGEDLLTAYQKALAGDPVSAFGGIVACNREVDAAVAEAMTKHFFEVIAAPSFTDEAQSILAQKKNLRLFVVPSRDGERQPRKQIRTIEGGYLVQDWDLGITPPQEWQVVTSQAPSPQDLEELEFAWRVVKHVKSNAIVVAKGGQVLGVGAGQMNRVGAAKIALEQAGENAKGAYLASDAFFPFPDTVEAAAEAGIRAIIQPGGSIRDRESIAAANAAGIIMVFTGRRHFKH